MTRSIQLPSIAENSSPIKVIGVVGARPNFMKMAPLFHEMEKHEDKFCPLLVHTGQHYDESMSDVFFRDLGFRRPDINLEIGSGTHAQQTANIMLAFEPVLMDYQPQVVIVVGDTNSTVSAAQTAAKLNIPVAHVEAGLRSFDSHMAEEVNRIITDHISTYLFTPSPDANQNLQNEGIQEGVHLVGNIMIDTLNRCLNVADRSPILRCMGVEKKQYAVVTLHRSENVDNKEILEALLSAVAEISTRIPVVWPMHPRTLAHVNDFGLSSLIDQTKNLKVIEPLGYLDFLALQSNARLVLTDSGGIQEETSALGVPCLTLRENTERPITTWLGTNTVVGRDPAAILEATDRILRGTIKVGQVPDLWDGHTAERIISVLNSSN